jgi:ATP-dependent DNA ligase
MISGVWGQHAHTPTPPPEPKVLSLNLRARITGTAPIPIGSLLLGVYDHGQLRYAGNVGTGFTDAMLAGLMRQLAPLHRDRSPFATPVPPRYARGARWMQPRLVGEVAFTEWTAGGSMRHPGWRGLRAGKNPKTYTAKAGHLGTVRARGPASGPGSAGRDPA